MKLKREEALQKNSRLGLTARDQAAPNHRAVEKLLPYLRKVRVTGPGTWSSCCPAHDDKTPSLGIKETPDGTVLVRCHSGCTAFEVMAAIGMEMHELFPPTNRGAGTKRLFFPAADVLRALAFEVKVILLIAGDVLQNRPVRQADYDRLVRAVACVEGGMSAAGVAYRD